MSLMRIYHHHSKLEEYPHGMWKSVFGEERERLIKEAVKFTGNAELYGVFMMRVANEWKYSCEHNLTAEINRQAWIGHAACCLAIACPEDITRIAWHQLTQEQQNKANKKADEAIEYWEKKCQRNTSQPTFFHLLEKE